MIQFSHPSSNTLTYILEALLAASAIICILTPIVVARMLRDIREELESLRTALNKATSKSEKPTVAVQPQPAQAAQTVEPAVASQRPNEVTRADRGKIAKAIMAKTVLLATAARKPRVVQKLYVAKAGRNLGEIDVPTIRAMLKTGDLSARDHFYEMNKQIWSRFECLPGFCT